MRSGNGENPGVHHSFVYRLLGTCLVDVSSYGGGDSPGNVESATVGDRNPHTGGKNLPKGSPKADLTDDPGFFWLRCCFMGSTSVSLWASIRFRPGPLRSVSPSIS